VNLSEFEAHRPILGRQLRELLESEDFAGNWEFGWSIVPSYTDNIRFVAKHPIIHSLVCVSPAHPMAMVEEHAPGCQGTWWWADDLTGSIG
jgi:hypothetical protein